MLPSFALGLGEIRVRTSLGQSFLAHADVIGSDAEGISGFCVKAKVISFDGALLANTIVSINESANRRSISFTSKAPINEPAVKLVVDINCETKLHREFSILLDPPLAIQGNPATLQINPPVFGMQTLPDLVATPLTDGQPNKKVSKKQSRAQVQKSDSSADLATDFSGVDGDNQHNKQNQSSSKNKRKAEKSLLAKTSDRSKSTKDVLKLSDDAFVYPPEVPNYAALANQGLRMSDILSTQTGQELLVNIEELRVAQARMAAILRDEPNAAPVLNADGTTVTANDPAQQTELEKLKQEATQLKKQLQDDRSTIDTLKNKNQSSYWTVLLISLVILLVAACVYLFYTLRRQVRNPHRVNSDNTANPSWWDQEQDANAADDKESVEDVINHVQAAYDKDDSVRKTFSKSGNKESSAKQGTKQNIVKEGPSYFSSDADADLGRMPDITYTPTLEETNSSIFNFFSPRGTSVKVEEISDITQEAEFWISMNDHQRAIEILSPQEEIEHPDSPLAWLFLLDLYKTVNNVEKYNVLRERFISYFNANIPEFDTVIDPAEERHLDDFTHIMLHICGIWNEGNIIPYLESLLVDDREGKRMGFDLSVYRDILLILGVAHEIERGRVSDAQSPNAFKKAAPETVVDHLKEADIQTIEFETIDFPSITPTKQ